MNYESITLNGASVEISESAEDSDVLVGKFVICDFMPNRNDVQIDRNTVLSWMNTLIDKPLVGKIVLNADGREDFTSHNVKLVQRVDDYGNQYLDVEFDTSAFGTFTSVNIEYINGVEHIVAYAKIWKRFTKACKIIKERAISGNLATSWEISVIRQRITNLLGNTVRVIEEGSFLGHCMLGESVTPAYESSKLLNVASDNAEGDLKAALLSDINNFIEKEEEVLKKDEKIVEVQAAQDVAPVDELENIVEAEGEGKSEPIANMEDDTNSDEENKSDGTKETVETVKAQLSERDAAIIILNSTIQSLNAEIADLVPYKEKFEQIEQERIEQETAAKREALKTRLIDSKTMSEKEIEGSELIKALIANLDEAGVNKLISDKIISTATKSVKKTDAAQKEVATVSASLVIDDFDVADLEKPITHREFMGAYLGK